MSGSSWKLNIAACGIQDMNARWCAHLLGSGNPGQFLVELDEGERRYLYQGLCGSSAYIYFFVFIHEMIDENFPGSWLVDDTSPW